MSLLDCRPDGSAIRLITPASDISMSSAACVAFALVLAACGTSPATDAGMDAGSDDSGAPRDAGTADAGDETDAGSDDAGSDDAGSDDAGSDDAGEHTDAGSTDAGEHTDAGSTDAGSTDAGSTDGGPDAGEGTDAGADAGLLGDAGPDCSVIGCSAPIYCGETCTAVCGCCDCGGAAFCNGSSAVNCQDGCLVETQCGDSDCAVTDGFASCGSCSSIRSQYLARVGGSNASCGPAQCQVLEGHCDVGLGDCYHAANTGVSQSELDGLAAQWLAQGCDAGAELCPACPAAPSVRCDAGGCLLQ